MNTITWKYVKPLKDNMVVDKFEQENNFFFPIDLKKILIENNGGRPSLKYYDLGKEKNKEFKTLLSFNNEDIENIYKYFHLDSNIKGLIPFASDPSGNFFVIEKDKIGLWNHENDKVEYIADSFTVFLTMLHE